MAIETERIVIPITTNADKASASMKKLGNETKSAGQSANVAEKAFSALKSIGIAALALRAAKAVANFTGEIISLGSAAEETQNKFNVTFSGLAEQADSAASSLASSFGLAQDQAKQLLADTGDLLTGFGFSRESALDLSTQVQQLAVDLASFTNYSGGAEGASQALTKALLGEREQIKGLGIAITEADIAQLAKEKGITGELDRQTKAMLTLELAVRQSANAVGDFARSQNSFANQLRIAQARIRDTKVALGSALLPVANAAVGIFNSLNTNITDIAAGVRDFITSTRGASIIGAIFGDIAGAFSVALEIAKTLFGSFTDIFEPIITEARDAFLNFRGENERTGVAMKIVAGVVEALASGFAVLREVVSAGVQNFANLVAAMRESAQAVGSLFRVIKGEATFEDVRREFQEAGDAFRTFGQGAADGLRNIISTAVEEVRSFTQRSIDEADDLTERFAANSERIAGTVRDSLLAASEEAQAAAAAQDQAAREAAARAAEEQRLAEEAAAREAEAAAIRQAIEDDAIARLWESTATRAEILERQRDDEIREAEKAGADTSAIFEFYQNEINEALAKAAAERQQILDDELAAQQRLFAEQKTVYEQYLASLDADRQFWHQKALDDEAERAAKAVEIAKAEADAKKEIYSALADFLGSFFDFRQSLINAEIAALEESGASEEQIATRKKELQVELARSKKRAATFDAIVSTAQAVANALASVPAPFNLALAGIVGAAGALEIAAIQGQQLPTAQFGGSFVVPPGFNNDSGLVRVNSGEQVDVTPARQSQSMPESVTLYIGGEAFDARVGKAFNQGSAQIRRSSAIRTKR